MALAPGKRIGKYELRRKLGEGGFGFVFVANDTSLDREVALKFLRAEHTANVEILRRFLQEARLAAKIVHPGIVTVFECGQIAGTGSVVDGVAYIAMELLHGESLSSRLERAGRLPAASAMVIAWQVASALEAAHAAGIVHRDLKPDNIFLCTDPTMPGGERVKVLDFGIAKLATAQGTASQTRSMVVMGTPPYMSPEQCRSAAHIDHRSDIYALGCIVFELVCGRPPFEGEAGEHRPARARRGRGRGRRRLAASGVWLATRGDGPAAAPLSSPPPFATAPKPAAPETITIAIDATPKAEVYAFDGRLLGTTPYMRSQPPLDGSVVFLLKADGYRDQRVELPADGSTQRQVRLESVPKRNRRSRRPPSRRSPRRNQNRSRNRNRSNPNRTRQRRRIRR